MEIIWSQNALNTFFGVVDYLSEHWAVKEIYRFDKNVDDLLGKIIIHNELCPQSKLYGYRKCLIDEQNSLVYSIVNNKIFIITFLDNRSQNIF